MNQKVFTRMADDSGSEVGLGGWRIRRDGKETDGGQSAPLVRRRVGRGLAEVPLSPKPPVCPLFASVTDSNILTLIFKFLLTNFGAIYLDCQ